MRMIAGVLCVFSVLAAASVREAQSFTAVQAHIPFPMTAGSRQLPADE